MKAIKVTKDYKANKTKPSSSLPSLPDDIARCAGVGNDEEGWREGCETCLRRLAPGGHSHFMPPPIIAFFCSHQIEAGERSELE